ncbi:MAG: TetR/AcrR family transcriptional regulator [Alphaproteobacteria bacterium]|jgi:TetR/AcrR family transcriptional regulator, transcriptional repressor for nem operon|nr:TetR/AcrR family transcriptional regulator [Alphaproteobacteria bacterium]
MARTKEFDTDNVVSKAIDVFWSKGFEATSIQDLVDAMGINRGSIYATFGDKAGLFDVALQRYQMDAPSQRLLEKAESGDPRAEIELFFSMLLKRDSDRSIQRGCLITNSIAELSARDEKLATRFRAGVRHVEDAFYTLIKRGQETGDIAPWRDARPLARSLLATAQGMIVLSKVDPGQETLADIATTALSQLE